MRKHIHVLYSYVLSMSLFTELKAGVSVLVYKGILACLPVCDQYGFFYIGIEKFLLFW